VKPRCAETRSQVAGPSLSLTTAPSKSVRTLTRGQVRTTRVRIPNGNRESVQPSICGVGRVTAELAQISGPPFRKPTISTRPGRTRLLEHDYRDTIDETERRITRLTEQLRHLAPTWRWAPVVAVQALRRVSFITAVALVAELADLTGSASDITDCHAKSRSEPVEPVQTPAQRCLWPRPLTHGVRA
jgi:hypothetical protein